MKNMIPLILAVLLGLAAVLAVGRLLSQRRMATEKTVSVVAAAGKIGEGETISEGLLMKKDVPVNALPSQAIYWSRTSMVVGQKALRSIVQGDYVLLSDVGLSGSMGNIVGEGEWAVSMSVEQNGIPRMLQPGDEVAIIGTFSITTEQTSTDLSAPVKQEQREATIVLFPKVRVLDAGNLQSGGERGGAESIILALPPAQAQVLIAAQRKGELTLALRRPNDETNLSRIDAGMVDDKSFGALLKNLNPVIIPNVPSAVENKK